MSCVTALFRRIRIQPQPCLELPFERHTFRQTLSSSLFVTHAFQPFRCDPIRRHWHPAGPCLRQTFRQILLKSLWQMSASRFCPGNHNLRRMNRVCLFEHQTYRQNRHCGQFAIRELPLP